MKRFSIALTRPGKRDCMGPYVAGTKYVVFKDQNQPSPLPPPGDKFPNSFLSNFKSLALCPSLKPCYVTVSTTDPTPSICSLAHRTLSPPQAHLFSQPASSLGLGYVMPCRPDSAVRTSQRMKWKGARKFSASSRENYLPDRIRGSHSEGWRSNKSS